MARCVPYRVAALIWAEEAVEVPSALNPLNQSLLVQRLLRGNVTIVIAIPFAELGDVFAALAPFVQSDLAIVVGIHLGEPGRQILGQFARAEHDGSSKVVRVASNDF